MLSWPYAHLVINHFPVVLSVCALIVTIGALLLKRRGLWLTAMGALTGAGLLIYPVNFSGDRADRALDDPWYIRQGAIEAHDKAADIATYAILVVGAFAAWSWWRALKRPAEPVPVWVRSGILAGALVAIGGVTYTAYLGGKIIHEAPVMKMREAPAGAAISREAPAAGQVPSRSSPR